MKYNKETENPNQENIQCYEFYVDGMHCAACELLIEKKLSKFEGIDNVDAVLDKNKVLITTHSNKNPEELADELTELISKDGYTLHTQAEVKKSNTLIEFAYAIPIAIIFIILFLGFQLLGIVNIFDAEGTSYGGKFILGLLASVSSCMAIVGGVALSLSANYVKDENTRVYGPQVYFHVGRLIGFFVFGVGIGMIGLGFRNYLENSQIPNLLHLLAAFVMLILGVNLLDIFHFTRRFQIRMPKVIAKRAYDFRWVKSSFSPFLIGALTFFLPCGFTQSVQIEALQSKSAFDAGLGLLIFSLGTLPALALLSFSSVNLSRSKLFRSGIFYKTAGLIVILLAIINIYNFLGAEGFVKPILNF